MANQKDPLHVAMYPWFAMGHLTSFLHISNKLAQRGHRISFFLPPKALPNLQPFNLHPHLITFHTVPVPAVPGLPPGAETTADVPLPLVHLVMTAMDRTRPAIQSSLRQLRPNVIFFDFTHWLPSICRPLGILSIHYCTVSPTTVAYLLTPHRKQPVTAEDLMEPPPHFPHPLFKLSPHEARGLARGASSEFGAPGLTFGRRQAEAFANCDAIAFKSCKEMEGSYCEYVEEQFKKPVILAGPVVPQPPSTKESEAFEAFSGEMERGSIVYCALGSEGTFQVALFQELVLGLELTGLPFFAALKIPHGAESMEAALPEGFTERVKGRGVVHVGWVNQPRILANAAVGCFVTHCGSGSLSEATVNRCQMVLLPIHGDQIINARLMGMGGLRIGVEVERGEEDGVFTREGVRKAVESVMESGSEVGKVVRENHEKWRLLFTQEGVEGGYIDGLVQRLQLATKNY